MVKDNNLIISEGILSTNAQKIKYQQTLKAQAKIELSEPVKIAQAIQEEPWGYFQFPSLGKTRNGILIVSWQMNEDSHMSFGKTSSRETVPMMSRDEGKTWIPQDKIYERFVKDNTVYLENGSCLQVITPKSKNVDSYTIFPKPVVKSGNKSFYKVLELPDDLQGVYLSYKSSKTPPKTIHAKLEDKGLLRYAIDGFLPIIWWGDLKQLPNGSILAGVYPCDYLDSEGHLLPSGISFYQSSDEGQSWRLVGKIPLLSHEKFESFKGDNGFTEPTFEVLSDGSLICVMRTGSRSPMYKSYSYDGGKTWTIPEPFAPNGVKPSLLLLKNGVLALVSGRPGIQVRFSLDGRGMDWTDPIDMIPFMNEDGSYNQNVSCGYASILEAGPDSFYITYSDFTTKNAEGEARKSIWFRKITVRK